MSRPFWTFCALLVVAGCHAATGDTGGGSDAAADVPATPDLPAVDVAPDAPRAPVAPDVPSVPDAPLDRPDVAASPDVPTAADAARDAPDDTPAAIDCRTAPCPAGSYCNRRRRALHRRVRV
jgi:hypothetical protein